MIDEGFAGPENVSPPIRQPTCQKTLPLAKTGSLAKSRRRHGPLDLAVDANNGLKPGLRPSSPHRWRLASCRGQTPGPGSQKIIATARLSRFPGGLTFPERLGGAAARGFTHIQCGGRRWGAGGAAVLTAPVRPRQTRQSEPPCEVEGDLDQRTPAFPRRARACRLLDCSRTPCNRDHEVGHLGASEPLTSSNELLNSSRRRGGTAAGGGGNLRTPAAASSSNRIHRKSGHSALARGQA